MSRTEIAQAQGAHRAKRRDEDILVEPWKVANVTRYQYVAIPKDSIREQCIVASNIARDIADLQYAYKSGNDRWEAYKRIEAYRNAHKCPLQEAIHACGGAWYGFDCSSYNLSTLHWGGVPFVGTWQTYTGGLRTVLRKSGVYDIYNTTEYTSSDKYARQGALYWKEDAHVVMSVSDYALPDEPTFIPEPVAPPSDGDQFITIMKGTWNIRSIGNRHGIIVGVAKKGDTFKLVGRDPASSWYKIIYNGHESYIYPSVDIEVTTLKKPEPLPHTTKSYVTIVNGTMWIRSIPSTVLGKKLAVARAGDTYDVEEITQSNWYRITYDGKPAYISGNTKNTRLVNAE